MDCNTTNSSVYPPAKIDEAKHEVNSTMDLAEMADILISVFVAQHSQETESPDGESSDLCSSQHERAG